MQKALRLPFFLFLFSFSVLSVLLDRLPIFFLKMSYNLLPRKGLTKIRHISLDVSKKTCVASDWEDVTWDLCDPCHAMCFVLFMVTNIHSIHKITKIRNSEPLNKMKGDTEDSTVQGSKDREIELINRKISRKRKVIQIKKLSDTQCESNINTVAGTCFIRKVSKLADGWDGYS